MKLTVTQENLNKALQVVGRVATGKTPLPVLNNILFKTDNNRLLLAATNLEIAITQYIGSKIDREGSITVPAKLMGEFIASLPKGNVTLEVDGTNVKITSGNYRSTIHGVAPDEFPALPEIDVQQTINLPPVLLKRAIQQTVLAVSSDTTRPVLTGVYCHTFEGRLHFAATDGYRLGERSLLETDQEISAIIPAQTLQDVLRIMNDDGDDITVVFDDSQVRFFIGDIEITSRLIDEKFPDYRNLIPASSEQSVTLAKDEFTRITKVSSLFARESGGTITLKADKEANKLRIDSVASQLGENTSEADAEVTGDGQVTVNSRYLLDALGCIDGAKVQFSFSGKLAPCILTNADPNGDYKHIVMPLKS